MIKLLRVVVGILFILLARPVIVLADKPPPTCEVLAESWVAKMCKPIQGKPAKEGDWGCTGDAENRKKRVQGAVESCQIGRKELERARASKDAKWIKECEQSMMSSWGSL